MWFRKLSEYLLTHPYIALPIMFLLTGSTLVDAFRDMPLLLMVLMLGGAFSLTYAGLVTLLQGELMGACFMGAITVPYLIKLALLLSATGGALDWMVIVGIAFSCLLNVLIWVVASLVRRGYTWSMLMQSMTLLGIFAICLIFIFYPGITNWWVSVLQKPFELAQAQTVAAISGQPAALTPDGQKQLIETVTHSVARLATGMMIAGLIFCILLQVMMSRWWQGFLTAPGLLAKELADIRLSRLTGVLFALGVLLSSLGDLYPEMNNDLVAAMMPVAYTLFLMVGLNLAHYFFGLLASRARVFWILFFYIFFIYMAPLSIVLVAMIALFDIWIDFRKRFRSV